MFRSLHQDTGGGRIPGSIFRSVGLDTGDDCEAMNLHCRKEKAGFQKGGTNGEILFWNLDEVVDGEPTRLIRRHLNWVSGLSYSPEGTWLASSGADNRIVLTELETERAITYVGHTDAVRAVEFSPDGKLLASGSQDELVFLWDVAVPGENTIPLAVYTGHADGVDDVRWAPDGRLVASGSDDGTVLLWSGSPN